MIKTNPMDMGGMKRVTVCDVFSPLFPILPRPHTHTHTFSLTNTLVPGTSTSEGNNTSLCSEVQYVHMCILIKLFCVAQTCLWLMCKLGGSGELILFSDTHTHTQTRKHTKPPVLSPCFLCEASVESGPYNISQLCFVSNII